MLTGEMNEMNKKLGIVKCLLWRTTKFVAVDFNELYAYFMGTLIRNVLKNLFKVINKITTLKDHYNVFINDCK